MDEDRTNGRRPQAEPAGLLDPDAGKLPVGRDLLNPEHPLHPAQRGEPACSAFALLDLLALARWKPGNGLERGEAEASVRFLAKRWRWSRSRVQRFLQELEETELIEREAAEGRKPARISFPSYEELTSFPRVGRERGHKLGRKRGRASGGSSALRDTSWDADEDEENEVRTPLLREERGYTRTRGELEEEELEEEQELEDDDLPF